MEFAKFETRKMLFEYFFRRNLFLDEFWKFSLIVFFASSSCIEMQNVNKTCFSHSEMEQFDWILQVTWCILTNQSESFKISVGNNSTLKFLYEFASCYLHSEMEQFGWILQVTWCILTNQSESFKKSVGNNSTLKFLHELASSLSYPEWRNSVIHNGIKEILKKQNVAGVLGIRSRAAGWKLLSFDRPVPTRLS